MPPCLTWLPLAIFPMALCAPPQAPGEDLEAAQKEIFQKWQEGRDKLKSGKVLLTVTKTHGDQKSTEAIQFAFDCATRSNKGVSTRDGKPSGMWTANPFTLAVYSPEVAEGSLRLYFRDPMLPSFVTRHDPMIFRNMQYSDNKLEIPYTADHQQRLEEFRLNSLRPIDDDRAETTLEAGNTLPFVRLVATINRTRAYTWEKEELSVKSKESQNWQTLYSSKTDWNQVEGIWVPQKILYQDLIYNRTIELNCAWEKVNPTFTAKDFDFTSLQLPKGTEIRDLRKPKGVSVIAEKITEKAIWNWMKR